MINGMQLGSFSVASGLFGSELFQFVGQALPLSDWEQRVLGPLGVLVFGGAVLMWLVARLKKSDEREEKRSVQHDETIATLVALGIASKNAIEKSSEVIESVKEAIRKCPGASSL